MQVEVGAIVEGKITGLAAFGAFVELSSGESGLIHISEVSTGYVSDVKEYLKVGQEVKAVVLSTENNKISLSIKKLMADKKKENRNKKAEAKKKDDGVRRPPEEVSFGTDTSDMSFDDMLQKFKHDSDEKFQDLKRSNESKRSGGYKRSY